MSPFVFLKIETFKDAHSDRVLFLIFLIGLFALIVFYYRECSRKYDQRKNVRVWKDHHEDHVYRVVLEEDRSKSVNINIEKFLPEESSVCHWKIEEENACDDDTSPLLVVWGGNTRKEHALSWQPSSLTKGWFGGWGVWLRSILMSVLSGHKVLSFSSLHDCLVFAWYVRNTSLWKQECFMESNIITKHLRNCKLLLLTTTGMWIFICSGLKTTNVYFLPYLPSFASFIRCHYMPIVCPDYGRRSSIFFPERTCKSIQFTCLST